LTSFSVGDIYTKLHGQGERYLGACWGWASKQSLEPAKTKIEALRISGNPFSVKSCKFLNVYPKWRYRCIVAVLIKNSMDVKGQLATASQNDIAWSFLIRLWCNKHIWARIISIHCLECWTWS